jgi:hypothetical protein
MSTPIYDHASLQNPTTRKRQKHGLVGESKKPEKLNPDEAKRKIALFLKEGKVVPSQHCRKESMRKRGVTIDDILSVLQTGGIIREPRWDEDNGAWRYTVEGVDLDEDELRAVTVFFDENLILYIVTVF